MTIQEILPKNYMHIQIFIRIFRGYTHILTLYAYLYAYQANIAHFCEKNDKMSNFLEKKIFLIKNLKFFFQKYKKNL